MVRRMIDHICATIRKPEARKYFRVYLTGKMFGLFLIFGLIWGFTWYFGTQAGASPLHSAAVQAKDIVNPLNTAWVLVTAFLVFFMQAGFMLLRGGFAKDLEGSNSMIEGMPDTAVCGI